MRQVIREANQLVPPTVNFPRCRSSIARGLVVSICHRHEQSPTNVKANWIWLAKQSITLHQGNDARDLSPLRFFVFLHFHNCPRSPLIILDARRRWIELTIASASFDPFIASSLFLYRESFVAREEEKNPMPINLRFEINSFSGCSFGVLSTRRD